MMKTLIHNEEVHQHKQPQIVANQPVFSAGLGQLYGICL